MAYDVQKARIDKIDAETEIKKQLGRDSIRIHTIGTPSRVLGTRCKIMGPRSDTILAHVRIDERGVPMLETLEIVAKPAKRTA
jgi:hypothetical protein